MLSAADFDKVSGSFSQVITVLGTQVIWQQVQTPQSTGTFRVGMRTVGRGDQELMNTYGIDSRIFTARAEDFLGAPPAEFDTFTVTQTGNRYTLNAVHEVYLNDTLLGYKIIGKADR